MKNVLVLITLALTLVTQAHAQNLPNTEFQVDRFKLYTTPNYQPNGSCDIGVNLVLDQATLSGPIAILNNFVDGICEIYVAPNSRHYLLTSTNMGCGSRLYRGETYTSEGVRQIEIVDHRNRTCRDIVEAELIVTERINNQVGTQLYTTRHSKITEAQPVELQHYTCMAYFTGFDVRDGQCLQMSTSGCKNPFKFNSLTSCQASLKD